MNTRITIDPAICHGKPVIKGTRILVSIILSALAAGETVDEVISEYPSLTNDDIRAARAFGSELSNFENTDYNMKAS
ncbi:MAG: DUF433 domain-containing protein [Ignavibacteriales bacterium]|nr:DUF433 domain-containing protein [Ignavibacteriales bacterium]